MNFELALKLSAVAHLGLVAAGALMPRVTGLWSETKRLSPFGQTLFHVYYAFIGLCLVSFGAGSWVFAQELANGSDLARAICAFLAVFWTFRFAAALLLDVRPYLINRWWRVGCGATNVAFTILPVVYAWGALPRP